MFKEILTCRREWSKQHAGPWPIRIRGPGLLNSRVLYPYPDRLLVLPPMLEAAEFAGTAVAPQAASGPFTPGLQFKGNRPMEMSSLKELFINELKDLYSAENQIIKALPKMAKAASSEELRGAFEEHLEQTKVHVERLQ